MSIGRLKGEIAELREEMLEMAKLKTPNDGGAAERKAWMRKVGSLDPCLLNAAEIIIALLEFGRSRTKRTGKKKGGLGKR